MRVKFLRYINIAWYNLNPIVAYVIKAFDPSGMGNIKKNLFVLPHLPLPSAPIVLHEVLIIMTQKLGPPP